MVSLQFPIASPVSSRSATQRSLAQKPASAAPKQAESLLMRFVRSVAQARVDWATGGRT